MQMNTQSQKHNQIHIYTKNYLKNVEIYCSGYTVNRQQPQWSCFVFSDCNLIGFFVWVLWQVLIMSPTSLSLCPLKRVTPKCLSIPLALNVLQSSLGAVTFICPLSRSLSLNRKCLLTSIVLTNPSCTQTSPCYCKRRSFKIYLIASALGDEQCLFATQ